jgi:hypothetical protein
VHEAGRLGLDTFAKLRLLDINGNLGVSDDLPSSWFAMRALTTLDISNTGTGGTLQEDFVAFQELRVFRTINCPGISGTLPPVWGLLKLEVLEITNSALTGVLPPEWAGAAPSRQAAATATSSPEKSAATPAANGMQTHLQLTQTAHPDALGMQRLRVLDLYVLGHGRPRGGLTGALPASFAQLEQLQVSGVSTYGQG